MVGIILRIWSKHNR